jgi:hypothetical protein
LVLDERPARLDVVAHQRGEDFVGGDGVVDLHLEQAAHGGVHGGFPQLFGVHFAQALVALLAEAAFDFVRAASGWLRRSW